MADLYSRPDIYRLLFGGWSADLPFYRALAARVGGPILECGVGAGRVAIALAREGHAVHGVDTEGAMLDELALNVKSEAEDIRARVTMERSDVRDLELGRRFPLVIAPFNLVSRLVEDRDVESFLGRVRRHLDAGGTFAFDRWIPDEALLAGFVGESPRFPHPRNGRPVRCEERYAFDPRRRVLTMEITLTPVEDSEACERVVNRYRVFAPEEIERFLSTAGLEVVHRTDRFDPWGGGTATEPGDIVAYVCRATDSVAPRG